MVGYRLMKPGEDATIPVQVSDIARAVRWLRAEFGPSRRLVLAGHSSGAHVVLMALLQGLLQSIDPSSALGPSSALDVDACIGLSGPYHIRDHFDFERSRGLHELSPMGLAAGGQPTGRAGACKHAYARVHAHAHAHAHAHTHMHTHTHMRMRLRIDVMRATCMAGTPSCGSDQFEALSPSHIAATRLDPARASALPPILLVHGREDSTVPFTSSIKLGRALKAAGAPRVAVHLIRRGGHFDLVLGLSIPRLLRAVWALAGMQTADETLGALMGAANGVVLAGNEKEDGVLAEKDDVGVPRTRSSRQLMTATSRASLTAASTPAGASAHRSRL